MAAQRTGSAAAEGWVRLLSIVAPFLAAQPLPALSEAKFPLEPVLGLSISNY